MRAPFICVFACVNFLQKPVTLGKKYNAQVIKLSLLNFM